MKRKISKLIFSVCAVSAIVIGLTGNGKVFAQADSPFQGQMAYVAFNYAPRNWAKCDGQLIPISENQALFSLLGTTYGGDGRTTFALPDMRGRVPIHQGRGPGLQTYAMGNYGGLERIALTTDYLPTHSHSATATSDSTSSVSGSAGGATLNAYNGNGDKATAAGNSLANITGLGFGKGVYSANAPNTPMKAGSVSVDLSGISVTTTTDTTVTIGNTGGSQRFPVVQPYLTVNCIIAMEGIYPPRN